MYNSIAFSSCKWVKKVDNSVNNSEIWTALTGFAVNDVIINAEINDENNFIWTKNIKKIWIEKKNYFRLFEPFCFGIIFNSFFYKSWKEIRCGA